VKIVQSIAVIASRPNAPHVHAVMTRAAIVVVATAVVTAMVVVEDVTAVMVVAATVAITAGKHAFSLEKMLKRASLTSYRGLGCFLLLNVSRFERDRSIVGTRRSGRNKP